MYKIVLELDGTTIAETTIFEHDEVRALYRGRNWAEQVKSILKERVGPTAFNSVSSTIVTRWVYITEQLPIFEEYVA